MENPGFAWMLNVWKSMKFLRIAIMILHNYAIHSNSVFLLVCGWQIISYHLKYQDRKQITMFGKMTLGRFKHSKHQIVSTYLNSTKYLSVSLMVVTTTDGCDSTTECCCQHLIFLMQFKVPTSENVKKQFVLFEFILNLPLQLLERSHKRDTREVWPWKIVQKHFLIVSNEHNQSTDFQNYQDVAWNFDRINPRVLIVDLSRVEIERQYRVSMGNWWIYE